MMGLNDSSWRAPNPALAIRKQLSNLPGVTTVIDGGKSGKLMNLRDVIKDVKYISIFFGADWCPPCKQLLPALKAFYKEVNKNEKILEIIYVTSDNNPNAFKNFLGQMPWKAVPYDVDRKALKKMHAITTIPCLPLFSQDGKIISANIKSDI
jgi:nucleoredoxin